LLGPNGAGKSTLVKALAGELALARGVRYAAPNLRIGYFAQHQLEQLDLDASPLSLLMRAHPTAREQELRDFLGGFDFRGDAVNDIAGRFSGGEKARLVLALVSYLRPNLLLLDEPTNHLDLEMRQALAVALQDYEGSVVLVSHDRHLLRAVADELLIVDQGQAKPFDGDLEDYARWFSIRDQQMQQEEASTAAPLTAEQKKQKKREEAERRNKLTPLRTEIARLEQEIARLERERSANDAALSADGIYLEASKPRLRELLESQAKISRSLEAVETAWLEATDKLEREVTSKMA
jgi:ATP-binding cassette subfamily F protein 3